MNFDVFTKYATGILRPDAKLWKDEFILETELSFNEVLKLPYVMAVEKLTKS